MNKILLLLGVVFIALAMTSCKKNYSCNCVVTSTETFAYTDTSYSSDDNYTNVDTDNETFLIMKQTKGDAKDLCEYYQEESTYSYDASYAGWYDWTYDYEAECTLEKK